MKGLDTLSEETNTPKEELVEKLNSDPAEKYTEILGIKKADALN